MARAASRPVREPSSRRERRVREVHDRIITAATELFAERGVESVKVDDVCHAADIAQKTFFNHFPTKQHLLREIAEGFLDELLAILDSARRAGGTTARLPGRLLVVRLLVARPEKTNNQQRNNLKTFGCPNCRFDF